MIARVSRAIAARTPLLAERDEPFTEAAVACILRPRLDDDCDVLLIRRATRDGDPWSGQIGLPGGRVAGADASLEATALRETLEEVGLDVIAHGEVLGALDDLRPRTPMLPPIIVRPFVCVVDTLSELALSDEVAEARWVPLGALFAHGNRVSTTVNVRGIQLQVEAYQHEGFTVWGMTERILTGFAALLREVR